MKKVIVLILLMSIGLFACGNNTKTSDYNDVNKEAVEKEKTFFLQIPEFYQDDADFVKSSETAYADLKAKGEIERVFGKSNLEVEAVLLNGHFFRKDQVIGVGLFVANNSGKDIDSFTMDMELQIDGYPEAIIMSKDVEFEHNMLGTMKPNSIVPLKVLLPCQNFNPSKDEFPSNEMDMTVKNIKVNYH
ncbi:hypothetical protein HCA39_10400 [Listeria seeligeri]|uniref:hypothetical protein n=1 Tax=Listeria seeligeri TaxID=1640 RepID=UPI001624AC14|nr:hypothetical protein [Listeria seeligeri]MBC1869268.1 hypothetical protein [Listeria seeligeri]MBC1875777.1 hypothetical protein [Listeria seeligeri]MBC1899806.1 hypothetical protein [Listeria seeligeri]MBC2094594.1 hypothetical protein [Listeria seeligeri]MBC6132411.1 hypothetical protein [Listeria seeligeri]